MDVGEHKPHLPIDQHQLQGSRELGVPHGFVLHAPHSVQKDDQVDKIYSTSAPTANFRDKEATPSSTRHRRGAADGTSEAPSNLGSNFIPTLTRVPSTQYPPLDATPLPQGQSMEYSTHSAQQQQQQQETTAAPASTVHEVTQVTNSLHAPISSLTPLPNDVGEGYTGGVVSITTPTPFKKELNRR